jgi:hypothetical protein
VSLALLDSARLYSPGDLSTPTLRSCAPLILKGAGTRGEAVPLAAALGMGGMNPSRTTADKVRSLDSAVAWCMSGAARDHFEMALKWVQGQTNNLTKREVDAETGARLSSLKLTLNRLSSLCRLSREAAS